MFGSVTYLAFLHLSAGMANKIFNWYGMDTNPSEQVPGWRGRGRSEAQATGERLGPPGPGWGWLSSQRSLKQREVFQYVNGADSRTHRGPLRPPSWGSAM